MSVRAKFRLLSYETTIYSRAERGADGQTTGAFRRQEMRTLKFAPVGYSAENNENAAFWDASPTGKLELGTVNPAAWSQFELDHDYYLEFTPAD